MSDFKPASVPVSLRLPLDLVEKIKTRASEDDRSFNNYVERMLKKAMGKHHQQ